MELVAHVDEAGIPCQLMYHTRKADCSCLKVQAVLSLRNVTGNTRIGY